LSTWNVGCVENSVNNSCLKAGTERLLWWILVSKY
jgi:hypothetical protein